MILGLAGPVILVFHSGFKLGSFNSSVAFFCMLIVAISGLLGRYYYQRIHHGLYGSKIRFEELYSNNGLPDSLVRDSDPAITRLSGEFEEIEKALTQQHTEINRSLGFYRGMKSRIGRLRRDIASSRLTRDDKKQVFLRLKSLRSICVLGTNEILFSHWHVFHIPLLVMLVLSGIIHVAVVHFY